MKEKKNIIGIAISMIGLFVMGFELGRNYKTGENKLELIFAGLFIVFVGAFIVSTFNKKKTK
jgi:membrane protein DedA with SNARE-associated domain